MTPFAVFAAMASSVVLFLAIVWVALRAGRCAPKHGPIIGALFESMDFCDATRSHEMTPSQRARMQRRARRHLRASITALLIVVSLAVGVVAAVRPATPLPAAAGHSTR
jgi:hypothetical protein